jgi:hypothetical protein
MIPIMVTIPIFPISPSLHALRRFGAGVTGSFERPRFHLYHRSI